MSCLMLRLAGPLQAWGDSSRFTTRSTRSEPTKSGVLGLLAAAQGRRRTDPLEDLVGLKFGVRIDQPGRLVRDFQTARSPDGTLKMPLSYRFYLADAVFVVALEGPDGLLEGLSNALREPKYPLYLGRRSCVPASTIRLGTRPQGLDQALRSEDWQAATWFRRSLRIPHYALEISRDAISPAEHGETVRDVPVSFSPEDRQYLWRTVVRPEPHHVPTGFIPRHDHDPLDW